MPAIQLQNGLVWLASIGLIPMAIVAGCGPKAPAGKVLVAGTIKKNGVSVPYGSVTFAAKEGKDMGVGGIKGDGRFRVFLAPGEYAVAIVADEEPAQPLANGSWKPAKSFIDTKYNTATTSGLTVTAREGAGPVTLNVD